LRTFTLLRQACGADGGHVVEHHRQVLVNQRAQQTCHYGIDLVLVLNQRIHGT
jgi:hypothetical protein